MCRSLAAARINADLPYGNAPTTRARLRISRMMRSSGLLVRVHRQCEAAVVSQRLLAFTDFAGRFLELHCGEFLDHRSGLVLGRLAIHGHMDGLDPGLVDLDYISQC